MLSIADIKRWGLLRKSGVVAAIDAAVGGTAWRAGSSSGAAVSDGLATTAWRLSGTYTKGSYTLSAPLAITVDQTGSIDGGSTTGIIVADGTNIPSVGGIALSPWTNIAGTAHQVVVKREGSVITVHVGPAALSIPITVPAAPTAGKPVITGSPSTSAPLVWTSGTITGVPSPTVIYALVDGSDAVLQDNIVSGGYTRTTATTGAKIRVTLSNSEGAAVNYSDPFDIASITVPGAPTWAATSFTGIGAAGWTANFVAPASNGGSAVTDYKLRIKPTAGSTWTEYSDAVSAALTIAVIGQAAATQFDVQVAALNGVGWSAWSATSTVTTAAGQASLTNIFGNYVLGTAGAAGQYTSNAGGLLLAQNATVALAGDGILRCMMTTWDAGSYMILGLSASAAGQLSGSADLTMAPNRYNGRFEATPHGGTTQYSFQTMNGAAGQTGMEVRRVGTALTVYWTLDGGANWTLIASDTWAGPLYPKLASNGGNAAMTVTLTGQGFA